MYIYAYYVFMNGLCISSTVTSLFFLILKKIAKTLFLTSIHGSECMSLKCALWTSHDH